MKKLKIDQTDIFLEDYEKEGQGKITISDNWRGAFTYCWGAMGSAIEEFICTINADYFADKLCSQTYVFDGKTSARNVRNYIKKECSYELPWFKYMTFQKEMREQIKKLENCTNENEFVDMCIRIPDEVMYYGASWKEEREFKEIIEPIFKTEPWHFIGEKLSPEYKWLRELHSKLKMSLNSAIA